VDSQAVRDKRYRSHKRGDHSLCKHPPLSSPLVIQVELDQPEASPRERLDLLARRLEAVHRAQPENALVARELRLTLDSLAKLDPVPVDALAGLREFAGATA
jgi:hypothetical protein